MPKIKRKRNKAIGRRYKVLISCMWPRKLLPENKKGVLVKDETFTITQEWKLAVSQLGELVARGYLKQLPRKKKK